MSADILTITCRSDNYAYLIHDHERAATALIDAPEAEPILAALTDRGWALETILITHHHADHVDGLASLQGATDAKVVGNAADAARLPPLDIAVSAGDSIQVAGYETQVIDVSGHTIGHIAYYIPALAAAFTADSLMALGCGRVFEGTQGMMWASLSRLAALPPETEIYSGHEYTASNAAFAATIEPASEALKARTAEISAARAAGRPTVPARLDLELATNPFLRANRPEVKAALGLEGQSDEDVFAKIRALKDRF
ncbi:MAG: hydroxyacylglutathione hydrolase [Pseudomonadota bacterium]